MRSRIYQLQDVRMPTRPASGQLRLATRADIELVVDWLSAFAGETRSGAPSGRIFAENHVNNRSFFIWEDEGEPRTSAVYAGKTPNGVRIGFVYTPPEHRGRGYASSCVAAVSRKALDSGNRFCCLYTDLSNPTSNNIYQRLGYEAVCDVSDYEIS
jgi:predicted GNAT family acetyltransferase